MASELDLLEVMDSLAAFDMAALRDDQMAEAAMLVQAFLNSAYAFGATFMDEFERRRTWADVGAHSGVAWVAARTGSPKAALQAQARAGEALRVLPSAAEPARAGRLSPAHVGALAGCVKHHPELAAREHVALVDQALELGADAFRTAGRQWCHQADGAPEAPEPAPDFSVTRRRNGRWAVKGLLNPIDGALVAAAIDAGVDRQLRAQRDGDPSVALTAGELRAQVAADLAAQEHRCEPGKPTVPDRYRAGLILRPDEVEEVLAEEACDATFYRLVMNAEGEVLDVGRDTRRWPNGIRRAITARDGGCVFPGCDRLPSWCDVHHCEHWEDGGETKVDNGALLCRRHHTFIHRKKWKVRVERGRPVVYRDDGTKYVITKWQAA